MNGTLLYWVVGGGVQNAPPYSLRSTKVHKFAVVGGVFKMHRRTHGGVLRCIRCTNSHN